ncbi:LytTR family DNA-binding domain-containing protein [Hyphobacterium sp.]|uniref:LytTR family DNA-binding domain-containing protein n=1 Tax=Hyphobacterium sp. TaxID=2004662 RepID=UPI003BAAA2AF
MATPTKTQLIAIPEWAVDLGVMLVVGVFFALIAPYGSQGNDLGTRLIYWGLLMPAGALCVRFSEAFIGQVGGNRVSGLLNIALIAAIAAAPQTIIVALVERVINPEHYPDLSTLPLALFALLRLYGAVLIIMVAMVPFIRLARAQFHRLFDPAEDRRSDGSSSPARASTTPPAILNRIEGQLVLSPLIALEAEDHYVRVHTKAGSALVLIRLADAMAETEPVDGMQTHRSWWVAADAVQSGWFKRGKGELVLTNGLTVPVSRSFVHGLRERGLKL